MIPVHFHSEAEAELGEAVDFYESRLLGLGASFVTEVRNAVGFIQVQPDAGSSLGSQLRRLVVRRFPYSVIYRREAQRILILAVAHHRRRPGYWKSRSTAR